MDKKIGSPALLSDNPPLLPENCCNYKCFGIHMFISILLHWNNTKKQRKKAKSDMIPHKTQKMDLTK